MSQMTITLGTTRAPAACSRCGAAPSLHGGTGRQIRRNGWSSYQCGSRWHVDYGFRFSDGCTLGVLRKCLVKVTRMRDMVRARRMARDLIKATASDHEANFIRRYRTPLYEE